MKITKEQIGSAPKRTPKQGKPHFRVITEDGGPKPPELSHSEKAYFESLHQIIDRIYELAANDYEYTWCQLATHANLAYETVVNLGERQTRFPRFQTVYKLAKAVGFNLIIQAEKKHKTPAVKVSVG
jgi:DNA-binding phage protein